VSDDNFLSRWSRRKHAVNRGDAPTVEPARPAPAPATTPAAKAYEPVSELPPPLPPVESLTTESDFTPFMRSDVDPNLRQQALRTLFRDERFNVMDGLDVYIDDYSKPDPIPADWLGKLNQMARLGDYRPPEEPPEPAGTPEAASPSPEIHVDEQAVAPPHSTGDALPDAPPSSPDDLKHS
jgi:hypothetical protein